MNRIIDYTKKHMAMHIVIVVLGISCIVNTLYINYRYKKNDFNYYTNYEKTSEYPWFVSGEECSLSVNGEHSISVRWTENADKMYIQMLDSQNGFLPSEKYIELATIPNDIKKIQFDCLLGVSAGQTIVAYIIQFDEHGNRIEAKIENINTFNMDKYDQSTTYRNYSINTSRHKDAKYFKILFDVRANGKSGNLNISHMDVIFK